VNAEAMEIPGSARKSAQTAQVTGSPSEEKKGLNQEEKQTLLADYEAKLWGP